jgi:hypothetical protein
MKTLSRVSVPESALFSVLLWLLSEKLPPAFLLVLIALSGILFTRPVSLFDVERAPDGKLTVRWSAQDWVGLSVLVCVVWALAAGHSPGDVLDRLLGTLD